MGPTCCASRACSTSPGHPGRSRFTASSTCSIRRVELPAWPDGERASRLVFITRDVEAEALARGLAAFQGYNPA
jgi:hypothetical protein